VQRRRAYPHGKRNKPPIPNNIPARGPPSPRREGQRRAAFLLP